MFGYDEALLGHAEEEFIHVRLPVSNILHWKDRGFEITQGRQGPERINHCMREIGWAERTRGDMCSLTTQKTAFGSKLSSPS